MRPKEGKIFRGWWVVVGLYFSPFFGFWGRFILTPFLPFLIRDYNWTVTDISLSVSIALWVYAIASIFVGRLIDTLGGKRITMFGGLALMLGFGLLSRVTELWQLYLVHGVILSLALAMTGAVPTASIARKWFIKRAGLVSGIIITAFSVSQAILTPLLTQSASTITWQTTSLLCIPFGLIVFIMSLLLIESTPESVGLRPYGAEEGMTEDASQVEIEVAITPRKALGTVTFWALTIAYGLAGVPLQGLMVHIVQWAISVGATPLDAGFAASAIAIPAIIAKPSWGWIGDRFGKRKIMVLGSTLCALVFLAGWLWVSSTQSLIILCFLIGLFYPIMTLQAPYMGDIFGRASIGTLFGITTAVFGILGGFGPTLWGRLADITGSYSSVCLISAIIYAVVTTCYIIARRPLQQSAD